MTLNEIFMELARIENELACEDFEFSCDRQMCAMKPGHPAEILDEILCQIGTELFRDDNTDISFKNLEDAYKALKVFNNAFELWELDDLLEEMKKYIDTNKTNV